MNRINKEINRFWDKVTISSNPNSCWNWIAGKSTAGYGLFGLSNSKKLIYAHRYSFELCYGIDPVTKCVCHHCDNPACCNPYHLFLGSSKDNSQDMVKKGRCKSTALLGTKNSCNRYSEETVHEVRNRAKSYKYLQNKYGISISHIKQIRRGSCWGWLPYKKELLGYQFLEQPPEIPDMTDEVEEDDTL